MWRREGGDLVEGRRLGTRDGGRGKYYFHGVLLSLLPLWGRSFCALKE